MARLLSRHLTPACWGIPWGWSALRFPAGHVNIPVATLLSLSAFSELMSSSVGGCLPTFPLFSAKHLLRALFPLLGNLPESVLCHFSRNFLVIPPGHSSPATPTTLRAMPSSFLRSYASGKCPAVTVYSFPLQGCSLHRDMGPLLPLHGHSPDTGCGCLNFSTASSISAPLVCLPFFSCSTVSLSKLHPQAPVTILTLKWLSLPY